MKTAESPVTKGGVAERKDPRVIRPIPRNARGPTIDWSV